MVELKKLRIAVWAAYQPDASLMMANSSSEDAMSSNRIVSGLQREVYSWSTTEDVLGGIIKAERREALSEALFVALSPDKPPEERGIEVMRSFISLARDTLTEGGTEWSESTSPPDDEGPRRLNSLLAFAAHLEWLAAVHDGQPGVSVTAR